MSHTWRDLALLTELSRQCRFALQAWEDLPVTTVLGGDDRIWYSLQGLAVALANISKILWPIRSTDNDARDRLRDEIGVSGDSVLRVRTLRNHFEHLDERIEQWADEYGGPAYVDRMLLPGAGKVALQVEASGQDLATMMPGDVLWTYSLEEQCLYFRGEAYALRPYLEEVRQVRSAVEAAIKET